MKYYLQASKNVPDFFGFHRKLTCTKTEQSTDKASKNNGSRIQYSRVFDLANACISRIGFKFDPNGDLLDLGPLPVIRGQPINLGPSSPQL